MTNETLHKILNLRCSHHTKHAWSKETHADNYRVKLRRRAVQHLLKMERWNPGQHDLQQATMTQSSIAEIVNSSEHDETILSNLSARSPRCSACEEAKSTGAKPMSASHENREPWSVVRCDLTEWKNPVSETRKVHLWICADEATKFTVGHVFSEDQQAGDLDGSHVMELLQEQWIAVFGRMHTLRTDPQGEWCNKEVHDRLNDMQITIDIHPGETSLQESVTKKRHQHCERHNEKNCVEETQHQIFRSASSSCVGA